MAATNKSFWKSRTLWANALATVALGIQTAYGFVIPAEFQAYALIGINALLRLITKQGLEA